MNVATHDRGLYFAKLYGVLQLVEWIVLESNGLTPSLSGELVERLAQVQLGLVYAQRICLEQAAARGGPEQ